MESYSRKGQHYASKNSIIRFKCFEYFNDEDSKELTFKNKSLIKYGWWVIAKVEDTEVPGIA